MLSRQKLASRCYIMKFGMTRSLFIGLAQIMVVKRHLIMGHCFSVTLSLPLTGMDDEDSDTSPLDGMLDDKLRVVYFKGYLAAVAQAIKWVTFYHYIILYFNFFHINKWSILILCSDYMVNCAINHNLCLLMVPIWVHGH